MKDYKRKRHITNNTRDSVRCNDLKKSLNSSERQRGRSIAVSELEDYLVPKDPYEFGCKCSSCMPDWKSYTPITMQTTGGKFISTLMRLGILEGGIHDDLRSLTKNGYSHHPHWELLEKLATNKDGLI